MAQIASPSAPVPRDDVWYGDSRSADVRLQLDDGTAIRAHHQILRLYIPWLAVRFDAAVGEGSKDVRCQDDAPQGWRILVQRCYPPNRAITSFRDALLLVPLVSKYAVNWIHDELREALITPRSPGLGPQLHFDLHGLVDGAAVERFTGSKRFVLGLFQPGVPVILTSVDKEGLIDHSAGALLDLGTVTHLRYEDGVLGERIRLLVQWQGAAEEDVSRCRGDRLFLANYPGCPDDAELLWRHGFQDVVHSWFNVRQVGTDALKSSFLFDSLVSERGTGLLVLRHYIRAATSVDVLRLASEVLEMHMLAPKAGAAPAVWD